MASDNILDVKGLLCPLPVLRAQKALKPLASAAVLQVIATDPGTVADFQAFCEASGHRLRDWQEADGIYTFHIEKRG